MPSPLSRLRERARVRVVQLEQDRFKHPLRMLQHVIVPEADHSPAVPFQMRGSAAIHCVARNVLPSIEFDDEMTLHAREICEVRVDRMLTAKSVSRQAAVANMKPQPKFRIGHGPSQRACTIAGPHTPRVTRTHTSGDGTEG